jgi:hypothetical protein
MVHTMKTTKEILNILDRENSTDYDDTEYNGVHRDIGLQPAAFVHGYRVAEREYSAKAQELDRKLAEKEGRE